MAKSTDKPMPDAPDFGSTGAAAPTPAPASDAGKGEDNSGKPLPSAQEPQPLPSAQEPQPLPGKE